MIIGAGFGQGQMRPGVELGANHILSAIDVKKYFPKMEVHSFNQTTEDKAEYLKLLSQFVAHSQRTDGFTLTLGGDHTIGASTVSGAIFGELNHVCWIDAHCDHNRYDISPTGNWHGMPVHMLTYGGRETTNDKGMAWLPRLLNPANITYIGTRDVDYEEFKIIKQSQIQYFSMFELMNMSYDQIGQAVASHSSNRGLHISIDLDCLDPSEFDSTGCYTPNGMTFDMLLNVLIVLFKYHQVMAVDIVEFNPLMGNVDNAIAKIEQLIELVSKLRPMSR